MGKSIHIRRASSYLITMIMAGFGMTGAASAQSIITNTGTDSTNTIRSDVTDNCQVANDTDVSVTNFNHQSASSGNALAIHNTTLPWEAATTGNAMNSNSVSFVFNIDNTGANTLTTPATTTNMGMPLATDACGNPLIGQLPTGGRGGGPGTTSYGGSKSMKHMSKHAYATARKYSNKGSHHHYYAPALKHTTYATAAPAVHTASAPAPTAPAAPCAPAAPAPAGNTNTISNTGTGSSNVITSSYTNNSSVHNTNTVSASNVNVQTASTGNSTSAGNTTAGGGGSGTAANGNNTGVDAGIIN